MAYASGAAATKMPSRAPASRPVGAGRSGPQARRSANGQTSGAAEAPSPARRPAVTFLAGLGIGLALGAAVGILFAPRAGAETRKALRTRGRRIGNRTRDVWEDLRLELEATRRALKRKRRDAKLEVEAED